MAPQNEAPTPKFHHFTGRLQIRSLIFTRSRTATLEPVESRDDAQPLRVRRNFADLNLRAFTVPALEGNDDGPLAFPERTELSFQ